MPNILTVSPTSTPTTVAQLKHCKMSELLAWHEVSPKKRIILSRRMETGFRSCDNGKKNSTTYFNDNLKPKFVSSAQNKVFPGTVDMINQRSSYSEESGIVLDVSKTLSRQSSMSLSSSLGSSPTETKSSPMLIISQDTPRVSSSINQDSIDTRIVETHSCSDLLHPSSSLVSSYRTSRSSSFPSSSTSIREHKNDKYIVRRKQNRRWEDDDNNKLPGSESHGPALVSGVLVPEVNEEVADAFDDMLNDIGLTEADEDGDDLPSCLPLLMIDYIIFNISNAIENVKEKYIFH